MSLTQFRARNSRAVAVRNIQLALQRHSWPRSQMFCIVALTGGFGFLVSFVLLHLGVGSMALRYPLAVGVSYWFFLVLIWMWLKSNSHGNLDGLDASFSSGDGSYSQSNIGDSTNVLADTKVEFHSGGGGDFGGGGAQASFASPDESPSVNALGDAVGDTLGDGLGAIGEAEELAIPLLAIVMAVGLAFASLYLVYIAPVFFAELLVDSALVYGFYKHLRKEESLGWLETSFRRTALVFLCVAVFLSLVGVGLAWYAPGSHTLGQAFHSGKAQ